MRNIDKTQIGLVDDIKTDGTIVMGDVHPDGDERRVPEG